MYVGAVGQQGERFKLHIVHCFWEERFITVFPLGEHQRVSAFQMHLTGWWTHLREHSGQGRNNEKQQPTGKTLLTAGRASMCLTRDQYVLQIWWQHNGFQQRKKKKKFSQWNDVQEDLATRQGESHWRALEIPEEILVSGDYFFSPQSSLTTCSTVLRTSRHWQSPSKEKLQKDNWNYTLSGWHFQTCPQPPLILRFVSLPQEMWLKLLQKTQTGMKPRRKCTQKWPYSILS